MLQEGSPVDQEAFRAAATEIVGAMKVYAYQIASREPDLLIENGVIVRQGIVAHRVPFSELLSVRRRKPWEEPLIASFFTSGVVIKSKSNRELYVGLPNAKVAEFTKDVELIQAKALGRKAIPKEQLSLMSTNDEKDHLASESSTQPQISQPEPATIANQRVYQVAHRLLGQLPTMVKEQVLALPEGSQSAFFEEYTRRRKLTILGYLCWLALGCHYAYIGGKWSAQIIFWLSWLSIVIGLVWWIIDFFRIPAMVRNHNRDAAIGALQDLRRVTPAGATPMPGGSMAPPGGSMAPPEGPPPVPSFSTPPPGSATRDAVPSNPSPANEGVSPSDSRRTSDRIRELKQMLDEGLITQAEFDEKKARVLSDL